MLFHLQPDSVQSSFDDFYELTGEILGEGAYAKGKLFKQPLLIYVLFAS